MTEIHTSGPVRADSPWRRAAVAGVGVLAACASVSAVAAPAAAAPAARQCPAAVAPALRHAHGVQDVLVVGRPGAAGLLRASLGAAGARVVAPEPLIDGVRARVPAAALGRLACAPGVVSISTNSVVHFAGRTAPDPVSPASRFRTSTHPQLVGLRGDDGAGVGVAVIDTGISPEPDFAGRLVHGPDLSGEGTIIDSYGHGTAMAGIIGGSGASSPHGSFAGLAPKATLVAVKVAGRNGATDVSTVLEAMHWVAAYRSEFNIRVLNLSWGTPSDQSPTVDPLDYAVERLWQLGIVVVAAAGNAGPDGGSILKPADDPMVITAGAYDDTGRGTAPSVPAWSSTGPTAAGYAKPDLVAPGRTLVTDRSWGSAVEQDNPSALIAPSYIKGSGTSEAAAVTSAAAALLIAARPSLTPDQVKHILVGTAVPIPGTPATRQGSGRLDLTTALWTAAGPAVQQQPVSDGLGSLEASRGGHHVQVDCGQDGTLDVIVGEFTADCQPWDGASWTGASWTGASWTGASWTGASWTGASWTGASWTGASWTGASWTGGTWAGASWTGASWTGASWTGASWTGASWTGASWTDGSWTNDEWSQTPDGPTEFQTAWWGDTPPAGSQVPGE